MTPLELHAPPSAVAPAPAARRRPTSPHTHRLSLPFGPRLAALSLTSLGVGGTLGLLLGGNRAALVFRAENAHRAPTSARGWYFYHKTKNYRVLQGAVREGARTGARTAAWVAMFVVFEDAIDRVRGRVDALGTVVAGLGSAGVFSVWRECPPRRRPPLLTPRPQTA